MTMTTSKFLLLYILIGATLSGLAGCLSIKPIYNKEEIKRAENATQGFHEMFDKEDYAGLYEITDPLAKAEKSKEKFLEIMKLVRSNLGKTVDRQLMSSNVVPKVGFNEVELVYECRFEKGKKIEKLVWYVRDGNAGLYSFVFSDKLKTVPTNAR
jgi:hypothetical protein